MNKIGKISNKISFDSPLFIFALILVLFAKEIDGQSCAEEMAKDITDGRVLENGTVVFKGISYSPEIVFDRNISGKIRRFGCSCNKCLPKCCPMGSVYKYINKKKICIAIEDEDIILNYGLNLSMANTLYRQVSMKDSGFGLVYGRPCALMYKEYENWHIQEDGQLYVELPYKIPPWSLFPPDKYCIDTFIYGEGPAKVTKLDALICFPSETKEENTTYTMSSTCMLISCVFILATVAIYAWLPELRNLHGRVLMAYLLCLFVGFVFMSTMQILLKINNISEDTCLALTFVIYFSLLSAFFWLNVMCFDIWWTFSGNRGISEKLSVNARFGAYAAYAFSVPSALTIILAALEFSDLPPNPFMPLIKHQGCFLYGKSKLLYFYGPIVVLCVANMVFFILTAIKINNIKKQTSVLKSKESAMHDQHRNDKQRLTLYVKLFVVMGINWLLEVISAIYPQADSFWRYTDAYNVLIGFTIFVIFVCKRKIFRLIKKRVVKTCRDDECQNDLDMDNSRRLSHTSQWKNNKNMRGSVDTIRTTLGSNNTIKTTQC